MQIKFVLFDSFLLHASIWHLSLISPLFFELGPSSNERMNKRSSCNATTLPIDNAGSAHISSSHVAALLLELSQTLFAIPHLNCTSYYALTHSNRARDQLYSFGTCAIRGKVSQKPLRREKHPLKNPSLLFVLYLVWFAHSLCSFHLICFIRYSLIFMHLAYLFPTMLSACGYISKHHFLSHR